MSTDELIFEAPETRLPTCPCCQEVQERNDYTDRFVDGRLWFACPSCGREFRPTDRLSVFHELYDALAMHRRGVHADRMTAALLRYEAETRELVGLSDDASQAIFIESDPGLIVAVRFNAHGITDRIEAVLREGSINAEEWVDVHASELLWTHPRFESRS